MDTHEKTTARPCPHCQAAFSPEALNQNAHVCPGCGYHHRIGAWERIHLLADTGSFQETHPGITTADPLQFQAGGETYPERLQRAAREAGLTQALLTGRAQILNHPCILGVVDARFIMGSMDSALGERFHRAAQEAIDRAWGFICFAASGGARMHEGTVALMQMAKTANAVRALNNAGLPFISILTDPTSGGMFASFASLGDIIIAEPGAYIGFAGKRLIEGALGVQLPEGFQTAEYQFTNGFLDAIVPRTGMRQYLGRLISYLTPQATPFPA